MAVFIGSTEVKEFSLEEAKEYIRSRGKKQGDFYFNVYGWQTYYTLEPTFATPSGRLKEFPRKRRIRLTDKK